MRRRFKSIVAADDLSNCLPKILFTFRRMFECLFGPMIQKKEPSILSLGVTRLRKTPPSHNLTLAEILLNPGWTQRASGSDPRHGATRNCSTYGARCSRNALTIFWLPHQNISRTEDVHLGPPPPPTVLGPPCSNCAVQTNKQSAPNHKSQIASDLKSRSPNRKNFPQNAVLGSSNRTSTRAIYDLNLCSNRR